MSSQHSAQMLGLCVSVVAEIYLPDGYILLQADQKGEIGITLVGKNCVPYSDSLDDKAASERAIDFALGWWVNFPSPRVDVIRFTYLILI